jgi:6-phosphogluconolactonase
MRRITIATLCVSWLFASYGCPSNHHQPGATASRATPYVYVSGYDPTISIFKLDSATGALTKIGTATDGALQNPSYMSISPDKKYLYAIDEAEHGEGKVVAFKINPTDGSLNKINDALSGGVGSPHLAVHPNGKLLILAHYFSGHVVSFKLDANGGIISPPADLHRPAPKTSHQVVFDSSGAHVFVPNVDANTVFQYAVNTPTGKLTFNGPVTGYAPRQGPRHMAFHPNGKWAYTVNEPADTVSQLTYDSKTGKLSDPQTISALPPGATYGRAGNPGAHIVVHPSGKFVYTSNRGHNSISLLTVDQTTGRLTLSGNQTAGGMVKNPRDFGMDPTGSFLIVANQDGDNLIVFAINPTDGKLTMKQVQATPPKPTFVGFLVR